MFLFKHKAGDLDFFYTSPSDKVGCKHTGNYFLKKIF